jgi:hypothetical protein
MFPSPFFLCDQTLIARRSLCSRHDVSPAGNQGSQFKVALFGFYNGGRGRRGAGSNRIYSLEIRVPRPESRSREEIMYILT